MSSTSQRSQSGPSKRGRLEELALLVYRLSYGDASGSRIKGLCRATGSAFFEAKTLGVFDRYNES
jgi:hypothetical protein